MSTMLASNTNHRPHHATDDNHVPPHDENCERLTIASILAGGQPIMDAVAAIVRADDFHTDGYRRVYAHLWGMHATGTPPDPVLLLERLTASGDLEEVGGADFVFKLIEAVGAASHGPKYAAVVKRKAEYRRLIRAAMEAADKAGREEGEPSTIAAELAASVDVFARGAALDRFPCLTCAELAMADHAVDYFIPGILAAGQPALLGGPPKLLKTSIAWDMAGSLATGELFLNQFEVAKTARVAFFSGEGGLGFLQDVGRRVCASKRIRLEDVDGLVVCDRLPRLDSLEDLDALGDVFAKHQTEIAFFDPVYLAMGGADAGNVLSMGERLGAVGRVCTAAGVTPILLHHLKKSRVEPYAPGELSDLAWSGFSEFAGQWFLITRRSPYTPSPDAHHALWLSVGGRNGHGGLYGLDVFEGVTGSEAGRYWHVEVFDAADVQRKSEDAAEEARRQKQDDRVQADAKKVISAMVRYPDGETSKMIREAAGLSGTRFTAAIASLIQDGTVVPCEVKKPNRATPYEAYKLAE